MRAIGKYKKVGIYHRKNLWQKGVARDVSADCLEIRFAVARKRCPLAGNHADFHVFVRFEGERNDVFAVEFVADHARAHRVAVEAYD